MNKATYDEPLVITYQFLGVALDGGAVTIGRFGGPRENMRGRLVGVSLHIVAATTVAAATLTIGTGGDADRYLAGSIPVTAINLVQNNFTYLTSDTIFIDSDVQTIVASDGGATAGDADFYVTVGWY